MLIVGGGMAGLELARRLSELGSTSVVVLEQGPWREGSRHNNVELGADAALAAWLGYGTDRYFSQPWTSRRSPHYADGSGIRRLVGGRSLYWYGVILPIEPWALEAWPDAVVEDLTRSWEGGSALYDRVSEEIRGFLPDGKIDDVETIRMGAKFLRRTPNARAPHPDDPALWYAYSPLDHWRSPVTGEPAIDPPAAVVVSDAEVTEIIVENGAATGVKWRGADGSLTATAADCVVLAAGSILSAQLAMTGLPGIDRLGGLTDHIVQGFFVEFEGTQAEALRATWPVGSWYAGLGDNVRSNLFVEIEDREGRVFVDVRTTGEQTWSTDNVVEFTSGGPAVLVTLSQSDRELIDAQREHLSSTWKSIADAAGLTATDLDFADYETQTRGNNVIVQEIGEHRLTSALTWSSFLGTEDHEGGTLAMGEVVDDDLEFLAVTGLYAIGPCVFPRLGAANPTLTTLSLAKRLAKTLDDRYGRKESHR